jgi:hypothetical protein
MAKLYISVLLFLLIYTENSLEGDNWQYVVKPNNFNEVEQVFMSNIAI